MRLEQPRRVLERSYRHRPFSPGAGWSLLDGCWRARGSRSAQICANLSRRSDQTLRVAGVQGALKGVGVAARHVHLASHKPWLRNSGRLRDALQHVVDLLRLDVCGYVEGCRLRFMLGNVPRTPMHRAV